MLINIKMISKKLFKKTKKTKKLKKIIKKKGGGIYSVKCDKITSNNFSFSFGCDVKHSIDEKQVEELMQQLEKSYFSSKLLLDVMFMLCNNAIDNIPKGSLTINPLINDTDIITTRKAIKLFLENNSETQYIENEGDIIEYLKEHAASVSHNIQRTIYLTNDTVKYRLY